MHFSLYFYCGSLNYGPTHAHSRVIHLIVCWSEELLGCFVLEVHLEHQLVHWRCTSAHLEVVSDNLSVRRIDLRLWGVKVHI